MHFTCLFIYIASIPSQECWPGSGGVNCAEDVKTLHVSTFTTELNLKIFHYLKILFKNKLFHKKYIWTSNSL